MGLDMLFFCISQQMIWAHVTNIKHLKLTIKRLVKDVPVQ